jgi:hypothetical protein
MRVPYSLEEALALSPHLLRTFYGSLRSMSRASWLLREASLRTSYGSLQSMSRASRLSREAALRRDAQAARLGEDTSICPGGPNAAPVAPDRYAPQYSRRYRFRWRARFAD